MKVATLLALRTDRLYPRREDPGTNFCHRLSRPQGHSVAGRTIKNPNDPIGNRTRSLPACSAMPQPTAPLPIPKRYEAPLLFI